MADSFINPQTVASATLGMLSREVVLPALVWRSAETEFSGKVGDTVNVRVPAVLAARELEWNVEARAVTLDDVTESSVPIQLAAHVYNAVGITDEDLTLNVEDFGVQILQPQIRAVGEHMENIVANTIETATYPTTGQLSYEWNTTGGNDDPAYNVTVEARRALNVNNVPAGGRALVLGANVEADFLKSSHFNRADQSGSTGALRDAEIGRVAGFRVVGSNAVDPDTAYAFHATAFPAAFRAPAVPDGASFGQGSQYAGMAMRWLRDYDASKMIDRSIVSSFVGATATQDDPENTGSASLLRAVKIARTEVSG